VLREDARRNVCVVGLQEHAIETVDDVDALMEHGDAARSTGSTGANADSSRSHAVMQARKEATGGGGALLPQVFPQVLPH